MNDLDETMAVLVFYVHLLRWHGNCRHTAWYQNMLCGCRGFLVKQMGLTHQQVQETAEWLALKIE